MRFRTRASAVVLLAASLMACSDDEVARVAPPPAELTGEAIGYFCNMIVANHQGPKGHIFLEGQPEPVWFSSVRDTLAFTRLPEESRRIEAIYVNDMARASWEQPEAGTWIDARQAWFVVGSARAGGMGAPEAVPFSAREAAEAFATAEGGAVMAFSEVPDSAVLGSEELTRPSHSGHMGEKPMAQNHKGGSHMATRQ